MCLVCFVACACSAADEPLKCYFSKLINLKKFLKSVIYDLPAEIRGFQNFKNNDYLKVNGQYQNLHCKKRPRNVKIGFT